MSMSTFLERVSRRTWLWYKLFSFRLAPNGVDIGSLLIPYSGWHQFVLSQPVKRRSPTPRLPPRLVPGEAGDLIDGPDLSIALEEQPKGWVVYRVIVPN